MTLKARQGIVGMIEELPTRETRLIQILRHDPYAPGMAEKYGMPGKTDNEGWHWRACALTSFVSCRPCFLFAANNRLICTADTLESVSSSTVQLMIRAFCDFSLRSCFLIGVVEI